MSPSTSLSIASGQSRRGELPRLLYVGDVPPEATVESPSLLFRLLEEYPKDRLRVLFRAGYFSDPSQRLPGIRYERFHLDCLDSPAIPRRLRTTATVLSAGVFCRGLASSVKKFRPQAILTIAHGFGCLAAATLARRQSLPLHLVAHDDWINWVGVPRCLMDCAHRQFCKMYQQATSRFCITPYMEEEYAKRYHVSGQVLYPQRPRDLSEYDAPAVREGQPVIAFAGTVWAGYGPALRTVANSVEQMGGKLLLFSRHSERELAEMGLGGAVIERRPFAPVDELVQTLRKEADILFVPMDFPTSHNCNMLYAFPSKLVVYTATGLPMLIWGPPECSAVRWAREGGDLAEVVDRQDPADLERAIRRLIEDRCRRQSLASKSLAVGRECFSYSRGRDLFLSRLSRH